MSKIQLSKNFIRSSCKFALNEDLYPYGDITSNLLKKSTIHKLKIISNESGIIGGLEFVYQTFKLIDKKIKVNLKKKEGALIKKGDIICKQSVDARKAKVDEANALMRQRELEWQASKTLVEKGYRSQTQLAASSAAYDASKALVKQMEQELDNINIRAPFDGIFNEKLAEIGDFLSIGKPCGKVVDYNPIKITAQVSEKEILNVKIGLNGIANLSTGEKVEGLVTYVSNTADPATRTFRIEMEVENNNSNYKDGLTAEIFIPVKEINGHLIPPSSLTLNEEGQVGVRHIVNKNIAQFSKVEILGDEDEYVWIAGLPEKVTIITVGHEFVSSGDFVNYKLQDENS